MSEAENLRGEMRSWLEGAMRELYGDGPRPEPSEEEQVEIRLRYARMLARDSWAGLTWDPRYGGRGLTLREQLVFVEESVRVDAPDPLSRLGQEMLAPALMQFASPEQRDRFLPRIRAAEEIWCAGFSEPEAGSDLARLRTRADAADGGWRVSGQKVWTTFGQYAQLCLLLVRTDPDAPVHKGISAFAVDMESPGVTVKPIEQITGSHEFCEVFFDDAFVPADRVIGNPGDGWAFAMAAVGFDRSTNFMERQVRLSRRVDELIRQVARHRDRVPDHLADRLVDVYIRAAALRATIHVHIDSRERGEKPGPDTSATKVYWSETLQALGDVGIELEAVVPGLRDPSVADWRQEYLGALATSIYAGTSEIHRNIVADRGLGLPAGSAG